MVIGDGGTIGIVCTVGAIISATDGILGVQGGFHEEKCMGSVRLTKDKQEVE